MDGEQLEIENLDTAPETPASSAAQADPPAAPDVPAPDQAVEAASRAGAEADAMLDHEGKAAGDDPEAPAPYRPDFKFKAAQKEFEIPEFLRASIKDEKSEKELKSLLQKAHGSDMLIEKNNKLQTGFQQASSESTNFKSSINELRNIFGDATKPGGNILKLDQWFEKLMINPETILQYAVAKVRLMEMAPEQRNAIIAQMDAEKRVEVANKRQDEFQGQNLDYERRVKNLELQTTLMKPEIASAASKFEKLTGKPGSFEAMVRNVGSLAWHQEGINLPTEEAVKRVVEQYGLNASEAAPAPIPNGASGGAGGQNKPVIQRTDKVIPNVHGKANQSPLKQKPRSIEDLKQLHARAANGESV